MFYPTLDEVKIMAKDYNIIPVTMEVYADMETPISLFKRFEESSCCFLWRALRAVKNGPGTPSSEKSVSCCGKLQKQNHYKGEERFSKGS